MESNENKVTSTNHFLISGVLVSLTASVCCIGPFFLLATGISGAWMSQLMILEPYQPLFAVIVLSLFAAAGWKIFRPVDYAADEECCSATEATWQQKAAFFLSSTVAGILLTSVYWITWLDQV